MSTLKKILSDAHSHVDIQFCAIYERASRHDQNYNLAPQTPRRCVRQAGLDNHPGSTEEYYHKSLAILFRDHLQNEINHRFTLHLLMATHCLDLVPSCFMSENKGSASEMIEFFKDDLLLPLAAEAELELLRSHFVGKDFTEKPQAAFQQANPVTFLNVSKMLVGVMALPVMCCEAEGSFSPLQHVKMYLCSRMTQVKLSGLSLMNVLAYLIYAFSRRSRIRISSE